MTTIYLMVFTYCLNTEPMTCEAITDKVIYKTRKECLLTSEKYLIVPECKVVKIAN